MTELSWIPSELSELERQGLRRSRSIRRPLDLGCCESHGRRLHNFSGNDYLGLADDPRVIANAVTALHDSGTGARGSALVCGRTHWHQELEERLAQFEGEAAAILFPTGMSANLGVIGALISPGDIVFCDRWNHASLVDGCRLSGATMRVYRHDDLDGLARHLARSERARRRWIVTDSVFSMEGDLAPLNDLCDLAERYGAEMIVDEAHATGVFGATGRGVCELLGVSQRVAVRTGTLSKALGSLGGFVTGSQLLIDYLWNTARTQMYSTALPPASCAAALAALKILTSEPERIVQLQQRCSAFRERLRSAGVIPWPGSSGPIVPILTGEPDQTMAIAGKLDQQGYLVGAIRPPTVPRGTSRLRITLGLSHPETALEELAQVVAVEINQESRRGSATP